MESLVPSAGVFAEVLAGRATGMQITFPPNGESFCRHLRVASYLSLATMVMTIDCMAPDTTSKHSIARSLCHWRKWRWLADDSCIGNYRVNKRAENLEMSGILTAVSEMSGILLKVREVSGKSGLKLFIVSCIFEYIRDFAELEHFILVLDHALLHSYPHH